MATIFLISSMHEAPLPAGISDTAGHSIGYICLGVLVLRALSGGLPVRVRLRHAVLAFLIATAYGASDEFHQRFVPGRTADLRDLAADARGVAIGVAACWAWGIIAVRSDARKPSARG